MHSVAPFGWLLFVFLIQESLNSCLGCLVYLAFVLQTFDTLRLFFQYSVFNVQCIVMIAGFISPSDLFHHGIRRTNLKTHSGFQASLTPS